MSTAPLEDGFHVVGAEESPGDDQPDEDGRAPAESREQDGELETLRDEFVEAFNARDLDAVLALVRRDVETPDMIDDGAPALAEELGAIWERSPAAILTRGFLDDSPCAVAWLPDEDGCWSRAAVAYFVAEDGLISLVELPDDADALDRAEAEEPTGEELEEWQDWTEWDRGEETIARPRDRPRP